MQAIDRESLVTVCGGNAAMCTPDNPTGAAPQRYFQNVRDGTGRILTDWNEIQRASRSVSERVIEETDRAMAPWRIFNGLGRGLGPNAPRPNLPAPGRPTYQ